MFNRKQVEQNLRSAQALIRKIPTRCANGVALFAGEGLAEVIEPPVPVRKFVYHCDRRFFLDPLIEMASATRKDTPAFGVVIVDGKEALLARVQGKAVTICCTISCRNMRRTRRGGQSALRFSRLRDDAEAQHVNAVAEIVNATFATSSANGENGDSIKNSAEISGLLIGGPAGLKHRLVNNATLAPRLKGLVCALVDTSCSGRPAVAEVLRASKDALLRISAAPSRAVLSKFMAALSSASCSSSSSSSSTNRNLSGRGGSGQAMGPDSSPPASGEDLLVYGVSETVSAVEAHAVSVVIVTARIAQSMPAPRGTYFCSQADTGDDDDVNATTPLERPQMRSASGNDEAAGSSSGESSIEGKGQGMRQGSAGEHAYEQPVPEQDQHSRSSSSAPTLMDWLEAACKASGATLHIVQDQTEEEVQFARIGGAGGHLRFPFITPTEDDESGEEDAPQAQEAE